MLNETAARILGFNHPEDIIGKRLRLGDTSKPLIPIVGILKDYHNIPLREKIRPMFITSEVNPLFTLAVKINPKQIVPAMAAIQKIHNNTLPAHLYEPHFYDDEVTRFYGSEITANQLFHIFTLLAILISCIGMYGLVSFLVVQKTREVGIRKVLGASVRQIVQLFLQEFMWLTGFAFIVAAPLGYYCMHSWLTGFHYHIPMGWDIFVYAILLSMVVVWISVGYKAINAAIANPTKSLRTE